MVPFHPPPKMLYLCPHCRLLLDIHSSDLYRLVFSSVPWPHGFSHYTVTWASSSVLYIPTIAWMLMLLVHIFLLSSYSHMSANYWKTAPGCPTYLSHLACLILLPCCTVNCPSDATLYSLPSQSVTKCPQVYFLNIEFLPLRDTATTLLQARLLISLPLKCLPLIQPPNTATRVVFLKC